MNGCVVGLAQVNMTVGALDENRESMLAAAHRASEAGVELLVFPELCLTGYPPEDLVLKRHFLEDAEHTLHAWVENLPPGLVVLAGTPVRGQGTEIHNAAAVIHRGAVHHLYHKILLPNYGVFDEKRLFTAGARPLCISVNGIRFAVHICEDSWDPDALPVHAFKHADIDAVINLSASPYYKGKKDERRRILGETAARLGVPLLYCNLVGGQDELVFDGASVVLGADGSIQGQARSFHEETLIVRIASRADVNRPALPDAMDHLEFTGAGAEPPLPGPAQAEAGIRLECTMHADAGEPEEDVYNALTLGLRDYVDKNRFAGVVVALSGGIDSALVAALAVDAIGCDRVTGVTMPTRYSSSGTHGDAHALAGNLGIPIHDIPIQDLYQSYLDTLTPLWPGREPDTTEENLQARIRGNIIMALSNKFGWLVLTTGNKSELATGYCTLYGDMAGGFAVIKDVPKTLVYALARWRNRKAGRDLIPADTITRAPSAELREDQKDEDSLPPYDMLDAILERYVEKDWGADRIAADGFDPEVVKRVIHLVDGNEYKRRQGPPGVKITPKAFGRDRRLPITNQYSERVKPPRPRVTPARAGGVQP